MKQSIAVVLSFDPRFDTIDALVIPDPLSEAAAPTDQIYGDASVSLVMVSSWLTDWWLKSRKEAAGSP